MHPVPTSQNTTSDPFPAAIKPFSPTDQDPQRTSPTSTRAVLCCLVHLTVTPLPAPLAPAEWLTGDQKARREKSLLPKTFQNEESCQFLSSNNFQVQRAVKAQDVLHQAGSKVLRSPKNTATPREREKPLEMQRGTSLLYYPDLLFLFLTLFELLVAGKIIVFRSSLSEFGKFKSEKEPNPINYEQTGHDNTLETGPAFKNPCYKKAEVNSITENNTAGPINAGSPCFHRELCLVLFPHHLLFT